MVLALLAQGLSPPPPLRLPSIESGISSAEMRDVRQLQGGKMSHQLFTDFQGPAVTGLQEALHVSQA
jgi:hypothetical protein